MPNRILRDWTDSEKVDQLTVFAERFFTRLIMKADDYGRYPANPQLLKSNLFPLRTDIRSTEISLWTAECEKHGLITTYRVVSKEYIQIIDFGQRLRIKKEKYPAPESTERMTVISQADDGHVSDRNETKRNEVEEEMQKQKAKADKVFKRFGESESWLSTTCMSFRIPFPSADKSHAYLKEKLHEFLRLQIPASGLDRSDKDIIDHFTKWLRKEMLTDQQIIKLRNAKTA